MGGYIQARLNSQGNGIIIGDLLYLKRKTLIYYYVVVVLIHSHVGQFHNLIV
jgi:hypothetical protein